VFADCVRELHPAEGNLRPATPDWDAINELGYRRQDWLLIAAQFYSGGWVEIARSAFERARGQPGEPSTLFPLREAAWQYAERALTKPGTDRAELLRVLKDIAADDGRFRTAAHTALIADLERTLKPGTAPAGSVEALIDRLTDYHKPPSLFSTKEPADSPYMKLLEKGFDAVPALIDHLTDERLTRSQFPGFNNFRPYICRVNHLAGQILKGLACGQIPADGLDGARGWPLDPDAARSWWQVAKREGEEKWLLRHVLPTDGDAEEPVPALLVTIRAKYPHRLLPIYRAVFRGMPNLDSRNVAAAVITAAIPNEDKVDALVEAARNDRYVHRDAALDGLWELDRRKFRTALQETLDWMPRDVEKYWTAELPYVTWDVIRADDPASWAALTAATKRASVGLRMELLGKIFDKSDQPDTEARAGRLRYLEAFLDDATERDLETDRKKYDGFPAGHEYPRLAVRDFVALELARAMSIAVPVKPDRGPAEWAAIRYRVREALAAERRREQK